MGLNQKPPLEIMGVFGFQLYPTTHYGWDWEF
jgi:hypothetical protein